MLLGTNSKAFATCRGDGIGQGEQESRVDRVVHVQVPFAVSGIWYLVYLLVADLSDRVRIYYYV